MGRSCKTLQDGHPHGPQACASGGPQQHKGQQQADGQAVQAHGVSHLSRLPASAGVATSQQGCGVGQVVRGGVYVCE